MAFLESLLGGRQRAKKLPPASLLDLDRLASESRALAAGYGGAPPYPHAVLDHFIGTETVRQVAAEFPARGDSAQWLDYNGSDAAGKPLQHQKFHISDEDRLGPVTQRLLYELKSARFLQVLTALTGIENLIPDALNHGGGIHMNCRGALLKVHADFNRHPEWHLDRRLNLLLYLNEGWQEAWGGELELWDAQMQACRKRILPLAGRCVIFSTSSTSFHGHPDPIECPQNVSRKSIALYYYTNPPRAPDQPVHSTLWQARPGSTD